jgi:hypothetical protein
MRIIVKLPYPHNIWGITISLKRKIGFLFTNQSIFNFRENVGIQTSEDYERWIKENGESRLVTEMMYGAAQAYCQAAVKRQSFTKTKLTQAIASAPVEVQQEIVSAWRKSQTFGLVESKKKLKIKRS